MRSINTRASRLCHVISAVAILAVSVSCAADQVKVSQEAVEATVTTFNDTGQVASAAARLPIPSRVVLAPTTITNLARATGVGEEALRSVAPRLDTQPAWRSAYQRTYDVHEATSEYLRKPAINIACQWGTGQLTTEKKFAEAIAGEAASLALSPNEYASLRFSVLQLREGLSEAATGDDPQGEAAAVLFCYVLDQVTD